MNRSKAVKRLAGLYQRVESMRSAELLSASSAVADAEQSRLAEQAFADAAALESRNALATGQRVEWLLAESSRELAQMRVALWEVIRTSRERVEALAAEAHRSSRIESEQIEQVLDEARRRHALEQGRRDQATADDRFAARKGWAAAESARIAS